MRAKDDLIESHLCRYIESLLSPYLEESAHPARSLPPPSFICSHIDGMYYDCQAIKTLHPARSLQLQPAVRIGERANGVHPAVSIGESQWGGRNGRSGATRQLPAYLSSHPPRLPTFARPTPTLRYLACLLFHRTTRQTSTFHPITNPGNAPDECQLRFRCCSYASAAGCYCILLVGTATY
jgi:hypothetical protein